jgi:hypothetical protein
VGHDEAKTPRSTDGDRASDEGAIGRETYEAPELTRFGTLAELTQGTGAGTTDGSSGLT